MVLHASAVLVFGVATWVCWKSFGLRITHAVCAGLFGFFLASSGIAPAIRAAVAWAFHTLGELTG